MKLIRDWLKEHSWVHEAGIYVWFVILSLLMMGPVITHFNQYIYSGPGDNISGIYNLWWRHYAFTHGLPVTRNTFVYYPLGFQTIQLVPYRPYILIMQLLLPLFNEVTIFNILVLIYLSVSGVGMYWLVKFLSKRRLAAIIAGTIYMWLPRQIIETWAHLGWGKMWIPICFLTLFYYSDRPSWKRASLIGLLLIFTLGDNPYYGYFLGLMLPFFIFIYFLYHAWTRTLSWQLVFQCVKHATLVGVIVLLWGIVAYKNFLGPTIIQNQATSNEAVGDRQPIMLFISGSAFPWDYVTPSVIHPFLGRVNDRMFNYTSNLDVLFPVPKFEGVPAEWLSWQDGGRAQNYLGFTNLILAGIGLWAWRKKPQLESGRDIGILFCLAVLLVAPWVSGPPALPVGLLTEAMLKIDLPLLDHLVIISPTYWLYDLFPIFRVYSRLGVLAGQCAIALGGVGLAALIQRARTHWQIVLIASTALLIGISEFFYYPSPYVDASSIDERYDVILADDGDYTIVDGFNPIFIESYRWPDEQRHHQKPLLNTIWWQYITQAEGFDPIPALSGLNVRYVVMPQEDNEKLEYYLSTGGLQLVDATTEADIYQVIADPAPVMLHAESNYLTAGIWQSQTDWTWSQESRKIFFLADTQSELCLQAEIVSHPASLPFSPELVAPPEDGTTLETTYEDGKMLIQLALPTGGLFAVDFIPLADRTDSLAMDNLHFSKCEQAPE